MPGTGWPHFTDEEAEAVSRVLLSNKVNYWTGEECRKFEAEFAEFAGTRYAIALANGTVALDLGLHGLRIGSRNGGSDADEVLVTPRTFIASVSAVINAGAKPVFAEVDRDTGNIDPGKLGDKVSAATRAVICVHLGGWPCDMDAIRAAVGTGVSLIEDCAQAHGALYKGRPVGSLGDVAAWSFCQDKIMTTGGEGGMVTCDDEDLWRRMWSFKDHGKSYEAVYERDHPPGFRWLHDDIGTNWRMTEMAAVLGRIQLGRMEGWTAQRTANARAIEQALLPYAGDRGILRLPEPRCAGCDCDRRNESHCRHAYYRYVANVRPDNLPSGMTRDSLVADLRAQGFSCMQGTCSEVYLEKAFDGTGFRPHERLPVARELGETSVTFLVHPGLEIPRFEIRTSQPAHG